MQNKLRSTCSGSVVECYCAGLEFGIAGSRLTRGTACVVSLRKTLYRLLCTGSTQENIKLLTDTQTNKFR